MRHSCECECWCVTEMYPEVALGRLTKLMDDAFGARLSREVVDATTLSILYVNQMQEFDLEHS